MEPLFFANNSVVFVSPKSTRACARNAVKFLRSSTDFKNAPQEPFCFANPTSHARRAHNPTKKQTVVIKTTVELVAGAVFFGLNTGLFRNAGISAGVYQITDKLFAFMYSFAMCMCSCSYFSKQSQYTLSVVEISLCPSTV